MVQRETLVYRADECTYSFEYFRTINTFGIDIYNDKIAFKKANEDQSNLFVEILKVQKQFLMLLKVKYFQLKLKVQVFQTRSLTIIISKY